MKKIEEKEIRISLQEAKRKHHRYWGRYKFIHAKYFPKRFLEK
ncbi:hypothetical protein [Flavobacterium sp.]|nr:hypothetical protein [Flavobacterium sp.]